MSNNHLSKDKQIAVTAALAEGSSIRSIERMTGIHRDTIMRLGVKIGQGCARLLDRKMRNLDCQSIQVDEIWGFVGKKDRSLKESDNVYEVGSVWTYCAIDSDTKIVPSYLVGKRDHESTHAFISDLLRAHTSHVERLNASTRLHVKRLNRLTLAFSKKRENFEAAVGLHFAAYNFVRPHNTLKMTPAMAAGIEHKFWEWGDQVEAAL